VYNLMVFLVHTKKGEAMSIQSPPVKGRPRGSVAQTHRVRRDYRFAQGTLDALVQGRVLGSDAPDETAFVEQAIVHYTAFLAGQVQANQEVARLQSRVRDLERDLARTQQELHLAEAKKKPQPALAARPGPRKPLYQILIKHHAGPCPLLPDGYGFLYTQENDDHQCPTHLVFAAPCPIDQARRRIEVLKRVPGLVRIWLTKDGYGVALDDWSKGTSTWQSAN
ncbi:MAG TPA: hypothetical protein VIY29_28420, partial [Ktedonobacteraceae bacterium]